MAWTPTLAIRDAVSPRDSPGQPDDATDMAEALPRVDG